MSDTSITLIMGPMKSGKTLQLALFGCKYSKAMKVIVLKPRIDITSSVGEICSRTGLSCKCLDVERLGDVEHMEEFITARFILIDEAQFFPDLKEHVLKWCDRKSYVIGGLDADNEQQRFGQIWELIPYAKKVKKLTALCELCNDGTVAVATISLGKKTEQIQIDDRAESTYRAVCLKCIQNRN